MKKIVSTIGIFLALAIVGTLAAQSNSYQTSVVMMTKEDPTHILRQRINRPITTLQLKGKCSAQLFYDTANFIDVIYDHQKSDPINDEHITIKGMTLTIDDNDGEVLYQIHLKESDLLKIVNSPDATLLYMDTFSAYSSTGSFADSLPSFSSNANLATSQALDIARKQLEEAREQLHNSRKQLKNATNDIVTDTVIATDDPIEIMIEEGFNFDYNEQPQYEFRDRTSSAFLWAFNNWGDKWYNGLSKMDGAYNLRSTFSSVQLEMSYSIVMTRHFDFAIGLGLGLDNFKFTTPLVDIDNNGILCDRITSLPNQSYDDFTQANQIFANTRLDDWKSHLRYAYTSLPVSVGFRADNIKLRFTFLPAICGAQLKHKLNDENLRYRDKENLSNHIRPFKMDLRVDLSYNLIGIFLQTATTSFFNDYCPDVYPIRIGLILRP